MRPFQLEPAGRTAHGIGDRRADAALAWLAGGLVFLFRLSSLRDLTNDHYMHLAWSQQVLLGDLPGRDFVDPGMPLQWAASALAQLVSAGPFSEMVLTTLMCGLAGAATYWVIVRLTASHIAAAFGVFIATAFVTRLYGYPKLLVPALILFLLQRYADAPTRARQFWLACGLVVATLLRHDLGVDAILAVTLSLAVIHRRSMRQAAEAIAWTGALTLLVALPYLAYVGWTEGVTEHVRRGLEFAKAESAQFDYAQPTFEWWAKGGAFSRDDAVAVLYYVSWLLPVAALVHLGTAWRSAPDRVPGLFASVVFLATYLPVILRHPINSRLADIAVPFAIVGAVVAHAVLSPAWRALRSAGRSVPIRVVAAAATLTIAVATSSTVYSVARLGKFDEELDETGVKQGPRAVLHKLDELREASSAWPWARYWPNSGGFPQAVVYLRECTAEGDYVLLTWPSAEYFFYSQRKFASGLSMFLAPNAFTTERDQAFIVSRLEKERPPVALVNESLGEQFQRAYPKVDAYIRANYRPSATYKHYDDADITIAIRNDLTPTTAFGDAGWPCPVARADRTPSR